MREIEIPEDAGAKFWPRRKFPSLPSPKVREALRDLCFPKHNLEARNRRAW